MVATAENGPPDPGNDPAGGGPAPSDADAFADRLFAATLGAIDVLSVHVGDRLGWYRALVPRARGPVLGCGDHARPPAGRWPGACRGQRRPWDRR